MKEQRTAKGSTSSHVWEHLEEFVREHVQRFIQALLEEQSRSWWGDRSPSGGQRWMRRRVPQWARQAAAARADEG